MGDYMNATFLQRFLAYIIDILIIVILLNLITYNINFDKRNDFLPFHAHAPHSMLNAQLRTFSCEKSSSASSC